MTTSFGFELIREQALPELNSTARLYRHGKTGAELLSILNDDENKVFGVTFRTPPSDSTGVAHILEHSVLCGSRKYPVKNPFVELKKGSLYTFLNAMTFPDKTCYPVASQNLQDFYNLVDVYLDAVFYPRIAPHVLQQEGWHYDLETVGAPLIYKGVVFNEMKGAYSSPDNVLQKQSQHSLFPDTTYGLDSAGDPRDIPDLTYERFKSFHERYYHPSNARLFFYGDDDPDQRLRLLDTCLNDFDAIKIDTTVTLQPRFSAPKRLARTFAAGESDADAGKAMVTVNWMFDEVSDAEISLALKILVYILIGTRASPLHKALIDSGLGEDLSGAGFDSELRQMMFSIGLKGIDASDADRIETLILDTLSALAEHGIDRLTVEASLNTTEFRLREYNTGTFPRGIAVMRLALGNWLYERDPLAPLAFEKPLGTIKARIASGQRYFEDLIRRYFLGNVHRTTLVLRPDPEQAERDAAAERGRLDAARAAMSEADLHKAVEATHMLMRLQETPDTPEALAKIPALKLADLPRQNRPIPLEVTKIRDTQVLYHDLFTNGIVYLDLGLDLHVLPADLLPYAQLFGEALLETGVGTEDFVKLAQRIGRATGGIRPAVAVGAIRDSDRSAAWLFLHAKAVGERAGELLAILRDVLMDARLDNRERFRQLVLEAKAAQEARLADAGHDFVHSRLCATLHEANWATEQTKGISYLFFLRKVAEQVDNDWPSVEGALQTIRRTLVNRGAMLCNVTSDSGDWVRFEPQLTELLAGLPPSVATPERWPVAERPRFEGLTIPATVNFVGKGADLLNLGYKPSGATEVVVHYLSNTWLWEKVRVQGGAYGGFCTFDRDCGAFTFLSYRDPNLLATLDIYDRTAEFLKSASMSDTEVMQSIIGTIGKIDTYRLPDMKGLTSMWRYLTANFDAVRQRMRDEVLSTVRADFRDFAELMAAVADHGRVVVLGSEQAIEGANAERSGFLTVSKVA